MGMGVALWAVLWGAATVGLLVQPHDSTSNRWMQRGDDSGLEACLQAEEEAGAHGGLARSSRKPWDVVSREGPRLAVVRPVVASQAALLAAEIVRWDEDPDAWPCLAENASSRPSGSRFLDLLGLRLFGLAPRDARPVLVIYANKDLEGVKAGGVGEAVAQSRAVAQCFSATSYASANLDAEQDRYVYAPMQRETSAGTCNMFFPLFHPPGEQQWQVEDLQKVGPPGHDDVASALRGVDAFFYMEPDVVAVRRGWLDALEAQRVAMAEAGAWVSGSPAAYPVRSRDVYWSYETNKRHLNGNALYRRGDACFLQFLDGVKREYKDQAFDQAMYDYAFRAPRRRRSLGPRLAPKFIDWAGVRNLAGCVQHPGKSERHKHGGIGPCLGRRYSLDAVRSMWPNAYLVHT